MKNKNEKSNSVLNFSTSKLETRKIKKSTENIKSTGNNENQLIPTEANTFRLDNLKAEHLDIYAENLRIVSLIENGASVLDAIKHLRINRPRRTIQNMVQRYRKFGKPGLIDKRSQIKKKSKVLTEEIQNIILAVFFKFPAAGFRAVGELAGDICRQKNLPVPSESTVTKFLVGQNIGVKYARRGSLGIKQWERAVSSKVEQKKTSFSNELWQGDDTPPEIWVRKKIEGSWEPFRPQVSVLIDDFSRAVPGVIVSTKKPDAWTVCLLHRQAILPKDIPEWGVSGIPFNTESDQGANWISKAAQNMLEAVGINALIDAPYYPNLKGKIERFFRHLDSNCLRKLPGHFDAIGRTEGAAKKHVHSLLTLPQLRDEIINWIVNVYHHKVHSETNRKPLELWQETVRFRPVINEDDLNILLLKDDKERTISNLGIRLAFDEKHTYWSPAFEQLKKKRVSIRYNPESTESVYLYCSSTGEFICEAWDLRAENPKYTYEDIKQSRQYEKRNLQNMQKRLKAYHDDISKNDRVIEQQKEWAESRKIAETLPEPPINTQAEDEIDDLINMLRQADQRKRTQGKF